MSLKSIAPVTTPNITHNNELDDFDARGSSKKKSKCSAAADRRRERLQKHVDKDGLFRRTWGPLLLEPEDALWRNALLFTSSRSSLWNISPHSACGDVSVMLNGSIATPFHPASTFASIELERFHFPKVKRLKVILVSGENSATNCKNASLKDLQKKLDPKITYECKEVSEYVYVYDDVIIIIINNNNYYYY
ncbi:ADP-ribosyl cyclase/cyclic ADP-ribose hydrolase 1 [Liparis tanakae]|uniref:ADP-ribosyl cyclase/cyclic ADP-ribose hydrolase n=1 Tax=Liparis tanakae TaxID=230148 RepID=A0A4Z2E8T4_9TELE|nr:ADP-ribosyl cyclase/cyclic ADP-ribose hydrolase 1 [Liparis tanakae]